MFSYFCLLIGGSVYFYLLSVMESLSKQLCVPDIFIIVMGFGSGNEEDNI